MSANGTNSRPFANSSMREFMPEWSPDGAYMVYVRSPALNVNEIVIARVSDGSIVRTIPEPTVVVLSEAKDLFVLVKEQSLGRISSAMIFAPPWHSLRMGSVVSVVTPRRE
ncbi:MAG: hypothetical protein JWM95_3088 [Gemmatimonadetes bacterium]|nr:hypothetical protein [Gemmatimonadota bacterium]